MKKRHLHTPIVSRAYGGLPVVEAKGDLLIHVTQKDVDKSTRKDPNNCAIAQACRRSFDAGVVLFYKHIAYVDLPGPHGKRVVQRFALSSETKRLIAKFDRTGKFQVNTGPLVLKAPPPTNTLEAIRGRQTSFSKVPEKRRAGHRRLKFDATVRNGSNALQSLHST